MFAAAVALRFFGLADPGLWHDEALSHYYASQDVDWLLYYCARQINHPPLFFLLLKGWLGLVPTYSQYAVEVLPAVFGVATVGVLLHWGRCRLPRYGWIPGLLLGLNVFHVYYSGELRMYALQTFFLACAGYFTDRLLRREHTVHWFGLGLSCLLALYTHSFSGIVVLLLLLALAVFVGRHRPIRYGVTVSCLVLLYLPWGYFVLRQALRIKDGYWIAPFRWSYLLELSRLLGGVGGDLSFGWYGLLVPLVLWAGVYYPALRALERSDPSWSVTMGLVAVGPVLFVTAISLGGQSVFLPRIFLPVLPFLLLLAGRGLIEYRGSVLGIVLVLYAGLLLGETVTLKRNPPNQYAREVAEWTEKRGLAETHLVHTSSFTYFPSIFYHGGRYDEYLQTGGEHTRRPLEPEVLRRLLEEGERVLLLTPGEPPETVVEEVETSLQWLDRKTVSDRSYRLYRVRPEWTPG